MKATEKYSASFGISNVIARPGLFLLEDMNNQLLKPAHHETGVGPALVWKRKEPLAKVLLQQCAVLCETKRVKYIIDDLENEYILQQWTEYVQEYRRAIPLAIN